MLDQLQQYSHPLVLHNQNQPSEEWAVLNSGTNAKYLNFQGQQKPFSTSKVNEIPKHQSPQHQFDIPLFKTYQQLAHCVYLNLEKDENCLKHSLQYHQIQLDHPNVDLRLS